MASVLKGSADKLQLTVFEGREYRLPIDAFRSASKELLYKKVENVKARKIELVKVESDYFLKLNIQRQLKEKPCQIGFSFNNQSYEVNVVDNSLFEVMSYAQYEAFYQEQPIEEAMRFSNKVVHLGNGNCIYPC